MCVAKGLCMELNQVGLYLLDLDGTFYLGDELLPGAAEFLGICRTKNIPFAFLTNNSSRSASDYIDKLSRMGISIFRDEIFTSGDAALWWMEKNKYPKDILLIGTNSLKEDFRTHGYIVDSPYPQAVVLGFDTDINYEKLTMLCNTVSSGIPYIATHPDVTCPVRKGKIPDVGAVIAFVKAATGRVPDEIIGKPNILMAQMISFQRRIPVETFCMIGDRLYTDIAFGNGLFDTILVLSGESSMDDLESSTVQPSRVFPSIKEIANCL